MTATASRLRTTATASRLRMTRRDLALADRTVDLNEPTPPRLPL